MLLYCPVAVFGWSTSGPVENRPTSKKSKRILRSEIASRSVENQAHPAPSKSVQVRLLKKEQEAGRKTNTLLRGRRI